MFWFGSMQWLTCNQLRTHGDCLWLSFCLRHLLFFFWNWRHCPLLCLSHTFAPCHRNFVSVRRSLLSKFLFRSLFRADVRFAADRVLKTSNYRITLSLLLSLSHLSPPPTPRSTHAWARIIPSLRPRDFWIIASFACFTSPLPHNLFVCCYCCPWKYFHKLI